MDEIRNTYRILIGKLDRIRPQGISRRKMGNNIKIGLIFIAVFDFVYWIYLAQDRDKWRGCFEHGDEPSGSTKCREFLV